MATLQEINDEIEAIFHAHTDRETGEIDMDAVEAALEGLTVAREQKILNCGAYLIGLETEAEMVRACAEPHKKRAAEYEERARILEAQAERFKAYIERNVEPGEKMKDARVRVSWRKSTRTRFDRDDEAAFCERHRDEPGLVKTTLSPRKSEIASALKTGEKVAGAWLEERQNLQVKP
jgi:hypothetical protein